MSNSNVSNANNQLGSNRSKNQNSRSKNRGAGDKSQDKRDSSDNSNGSTNGKSERQARVANFEKKISEGDFLNVRLKYDMDTTEVEKSQVSHTDCNNVTNNDISTHIVSISEALSTVANENVQYQSMKTNYNKNKKTQGKNPSKNMKVPSHEKKSNNYLSNHTAVANTNSVMNGTTKSGMDSTGNPHNKPNAIFSNRLIQQSIKPVNGKQVAELNNYRTQGRHDKKEDNPNNNKRRSSANHSAARLSFDKEEAERNRKSNKGIKPQARKCMLGRPIY